MLLLAILLPTVLANKKLDFRFEECESYCLNQNPFSFTYTKMACPAGGPRVDDGGFKADECDEDDLTITYVDIYGEKITTQTTLEEAMYQCGNERIVTLEDGKTWWSPEYKYQQSVLRCRDGHGDGSGWDGDEFGHTPDKDALKDDVIYTECLQAAFDACVYKEPDSENCLKEENQNEDYQCTFCVDCETGADRRTCYKYRDEYAKAEQKCYTDDSKRGYQACLERAADVYGLEVFKRERICEKTFILDRASIACNDTGGMGYISCCCQVKGTMITHPPEVACIDKEPFDVCMKWRGHDYCEPNHAHYDWMVENCPNTCGVCAPFPEAKKGCAEDDSDCLCMDKLAKEMHALNGMAEYNHECIKADTKEKCQSLSGKWGKNGGCKPAKNEKKIKCAKAEMPEVCRALGCDVTIKYKDGEDQFTCGGKPMLVL